MVDYREAYEEVKVRLSRMEERAELADEVIKLYLRRINTNPRLRRLWARAAKREAKGENRA